MVEWRHRVRHALESGLARAISIQQPTVAAHVERVRRRHPEAGPAEIIKALERQFLAAVTTTGAAAGGAAAAPGVGTGVSLAVSTGDAFAFLEASMLFALSVAEVHGVRVDDVERRRTLVLAVTMGESGAKLVEKIAARTGKHWGRLLTDQIPMSSIRAVNKTLGRWFVTKYGTKQGILVIGKAAPFGIGVGIGAAGNHAFGRMVIGASRRVFGPAPSAFGADHMMVVDGTVEQSSDVANATPTAHNVP